MGANASGANNAHFLIHTAQLREAQRGACLVPRQRRPAEISKGGSSARRGGATRYQSDVVRCNIYRIVAVVYGVNMIDNASRHEVRLVHVDLYCYLLLLLAIGLLIPLPC